MQMPNTTISIDARVRDRLKAFGTSGMNYSQVLTALMDQIEKRAFVEEARRRMDDPAYPWIEEGDFEWD